MPGATTANSGVDGTLADVLSILGRTGDAMVAVGPSLEIIAWNDAATDLFGLDAEAALGMPCNQVFCWTDRCGDPVCVGCPAAEAGTADETIETREVIGRSADGRTLWLSATTVVPPLELRDQCRLVHLVREVSLPPELERLIVERLDGWSLATRADNGALQALTPREREVLTLLTEGKDGPAIAEELYLSPATVRNHIQHILTKLGVHSRAEAVAVALRR